MHVRLLTWDLDGDSRSDRALNALLAPDERARAGRFVFDLHRRRYRVGRAVLRTILAECRGTRPEALIFGLGDHGKPCLREGPSFNLAHSEQRVLLAIADEGRLGVDVECVRPVADWAELAQRYFAADERQALGALPGDEREGAFLRIWTRKEALLKAMGGGLSIPLDSFAVCADEVSGNLLIRPIPDDRERVWDIRSIGDMDGAVAALALDRPIAGVAWSAVEPR